MVSRQIAYFQPLYNFARRYLDDPDDAEDAAQETVIKAWQNCSQFNHRAKFTTWLFKIAKNKCLDRIRKNKIIAFVPLRESPYNKNLADPNPLPDEIWESKETAAIIRRALRLLPLKYQTVLVLHYYDGLEYPKIALILGVPLTTVINWRYRGLMMMKKIITSHPPQSRRQNGHANSRNSPHKKWATPEMACSIICNWDGKTPPRRMIIKN